MQDQVPITDLLHTNASPLQQQVVATAAEVASDSGMSLYLAGGAVRDLLIGQPFQDLDFVVEGDCESFARDLAQRLSARLEYHERFLTAELHLDQLRVDLARARRETYPAPAGLPQIEPASLPEDLQRRDFTVNAMALQVWPTGEPLPIDPLGGRLDLERRILKVIHDGSFTDDPTRIFRGARLAARLGLDWDAHTLELLEAAVKFGVLEDLSPARLRQEVELLLGEEASVADATRFLAERGVLAAIDVPRSLGLARFESVSRLRPVWTQWTGGSIPVRWWFVRLLLLLDGSSAGSSDRLAARLGETGKQHVLLKGSEAVVAEARRRLESSPLMPHQVDQVLGDLATEQVALLALEEESAARAWVQTWLGDLRACRLEIRGEDLVALGYPAGPEIGRALCETRSARLDGKIERAQELEFAVSILQQAHEAAGGEPLDD